MVKNNLIDIAHSLPDENHIFALMPPSQFYFATAYYVSSVLTQKQGWQHPLLAKHIKKSWLV